MTTAIQPLVTQAETALALPAELVASAREYTAAAKANRTKHMYAAAWRTFTAWRETQGLPSLPASPATVALYLTARANDGRKVATLSVSSRLSSLTTASAAPVSATA